MSKPVKMLIRKTLERRLDGVTSLAFVGFTGIDAKQNVALRRQLKDKDIHLTVVKNSIARQAFAEVGLEDASDLLDGPTALAYGSDSVVSVVRELLDLRKSVAPTLTVKAAFMEGEPFPSEAEVERLSKFPTREEAVAEVLGCALSAGANLASCLIGPAGSVASILKTIEEKQSEGEAA